MTRDDEDGWEMNTGTYFASFFNRILGNKRYNVQGVVMLSAIARSPLEKVPEYQYGIPHQAAVCIFQGNGYSHLLKRIVHSYITRITATAH